jgi:hypothetical protein
VGPGVPAMRTIAEIKRGKPCCCCQKKQYRLVPSGHLLDLYGFFCLVALCVTRLSYWHAAPSRAGPRLSKMRHSGFAFCIASTRVDVVSVRDHAMHQRQPVH